MYYTDYQENINEDLYIRTSFNEKFESLSGIKIYVKKFREYRPVYFKQSTKNLDMYLYNHRLSKAIYSFHPVHNNTTKLIWFDIDCHSKRVNPSDNFHLALLIYDYLYMAGLHPELAQSSTAGNYHICCWFEQPQCKEYCKRVQFEILKDLEVENNVAIEIGPWDNKNIRPWHFLDGRFKKDGHLIIMGRKDKDLSCLKALNTRALKFITNRISTSNGPSPKFSIDDYVPTGGNTNELLLKMVREARFNGFSDSQIEELSEKMFIKGKCNGSLWAHLKKTADVLKGCTTNCPYSNVTPTNRIQYSKFWDNVEKGLNDIELFKRLEAFVQNHSKFNSFVLTCRQFGDYKNINPMRANRKLKKYEKEGVLFLVKRGVSGPSGLGTIYSLKPIANTGYPYSNVTLPKATPVSEKDLEGLTLLQKVKLLAPEIFKNRSIRY